MIALMVIILLPLTQTIFIQGEVNRTREFIHKNKDLNLNFFTFQMRLNFKITGCLNMGILVKESRGTD